MLFRSVSHFMQLTPDFAVITEEQESEPADLQKPTWILDPVDGTSNLMRGFRHSAISLALVDKGEPVIGLIYNPYTDEMFKAVSGQGASLNGQAIHVSQRAHMKDCLVGFGTTPYDRQNAHRTFELVETVFMRSFEIRRCGSAALDLAYVACGRLDVFFEMMLQPWDYAAGCLIITEAGGTVSNWKGEKPSLHHGDSVLASNGKVHPDVLKLLN